MIDGNDESPEKINIPIPRVDPLFCAFFGLMFWGFLKTADFRSLARKQNLLV